MTGPAPGRGSWCWCTAARAASATWRCNWRWPGARPCSRPAPGRSLETIGRLGAEPIDYRTTATEDYVASATGGEGFDVIFDAVGGATLDASFAAVRTYTGHVVSILGWGAHGLAPLSFRGATYPGVFTLLPLLTGRGRAHHSEILAEAAALAEAGRLTPIVDPAPVRPGDGGRRAPEPWDQESGRGRSWSRSAAGEHGVHRDRAVHRRDADEVPGQGVVGPVDLQLAVERELAVGGG